MSLKTMFLEMLRSKQNLEKDSPKDFLLRWSESQRVRTVRNVGTGPSAVLLKHNIGYAIAAGAFAEKSSLQKVVVEASGPAGIEPVGKVLAAGERDRTKAVEASSVAYLKEVVRTGVKPMAVMAEAFEKGLRFHASTLPNRARTFGGAGSLRNYNEIYDFIVGETKVSPRRVDCRHTLVNTGEVGDLSVLLRLEPKSYAKWKKAFPASSNPLIGNFVAEPVTYTWTVGKEGELQLDACRFAELRGQEYRDRLAELEQSVTATVDPDDVKETAQAMKKLKASSSYKAIKSKLDALSCERREAHSHVPRGTKTVKIPIIMAIRGFGTQAGMKIPGWRPANEKSSEWDTYEVIGEDADHLPRKPHPKVPADDEDDETENYPYSYVFEAKIGEAELYTYDEQGTVLEMAPFGVMDLWDYTHDAALAVGEALAEQIALQRSAASLETNVFNVLRLTSVMEEEQRKKKIEELQLRKRYLQDVRDVLSAVKPDDKGALRLPVPHHGKPGLVVQLYLPDSKPELLTNLQTALKELHKEGKVLRTITTLAPIEAIDDDTGGVLPLPADVEKRLLAMVSQGPGGTKKNPASQDDIAWRDLINAFNSAGKLHSYESVPIHKRLAYRSPHPIKKGKAPADAGVNALRNELRESQKQNAALLAAMADAFKGVAESVVDLKKVAHGQQPEESPVLPGVVAEKLEATLTAADVAAASVYPTRPPSPLSDADLPSPLPSRSITPEFTWGARKDDGRWARYLQPSPPSSESHVTMMGARWSRFSPSAIGAGGAYLVVRSVHDGNLYMAPKQVMIPSAKEMEGEGLMRLKTQAPTVNPLSRVPPPPPVGKGKAPAKPAARIDDDAASSSSQPAQPKKAAKGKKGKGKPAEEAEIVAEDGRLICYLCPSCRAVHGRPHTDACKDKLPWGTLSKQGKEERKKLLTKPKAAEEKQSGAAGKKPAIERVDPLKVVAQPLTAQEESQLRKYFGVAAPPKPADLEGLEQKEIEALRAKSALPKWAVAAVKADRVNLSAITSGDLDLEKFQAGLFSRKKKLTQPMIVEKWKALQAKFPNVPLLEKPRSEKEKSLKKEYDLLIKLIGGDHPALPKPKKGTGGQGGRQSPRPTPNQGQTSGEFSAVLGTLKSLAEVLKILRG